MVSVMLAAKEIQGLRLSGVFSSKQLSVGNQSPLDETLVEYQIVWAAVWIMLMKIWSVCTYVCAVELRRCSQMTVGYIILNADMYQLRAVLHSRKVNWAAQPKEWTSEYMGHEAHCIIRCASQHDESSAYQSHICSDGLRWLTWQGVKWIMYPSDLKGNQFDLEWMPLDGMDSEPQLDQETINSQSRVTTAWCSTPV